MRYLIYSIFLLVACSKADNEDLAKVKLKKLNGEPVDLSQYEGKTVFINFWATWCGPCIQEMPTIMRAQDIMKDKDIIFLLASNEDTELIEAFKNKHAYNFNYVQSENIEELSIQALPTTLIFNPEGKLKYFETGFRVWDDPTNLDLLNKIISDHE